MRSLRALPIALPFSRSDILGGSCLALAVLVAACTHDEPPGAAGGAPDAGGDPDAGVPAVGIPIPADPQRAGDAAKGYTALITEGYVSCGVPYSAYSAVFAPAPENLRLPGRTGKNADLPYYYTAFTTASGTSVVSPNCLACHAGLIEGKVVVGLGDSADDFTVNPSNQAELAGILISDPVEKTEWRKWADRVKAIGPYTQTTTVGVNPADNLAAVLFAHRDRATLAWSDEPLLALPSKDVVPVDVPPWWRMAKKNAMFYVAGGRGDHARIMMTASTLCTDSVAEAQAIDAYFPDVEAFIASIPSPKYAHPIDAPLAERGREVFEATCSRCHGTYGDGASYPNLLIPLDEVGTDPALATGSSQFADVYLDWFNESFYGEIARLEPQQGYVAPPLDGIWATAPYLHNGSVPTIAALLDSATRPAYWTRTFDSSDYDQGALGWNHTPLAAGKDAEPDAQAKKKIYDTTKVGYANGGHLYGDPLAADDRAAVIEYLKTL